MDMLLVNANRYQSPPIPPLGLEYLDNTVRNAGHNCRILDLCFSGDPLGDIDRALADCCPDLAGVTIRNIDTVLYHNNVFFLDDIRGIVARLGDHGIPVVLGGAGYSFIPEGILRYCGGDWGVAGPGELALTALLDRLDTDPPPRGTVLDGWESGFNPEGPVERGESLDYTPYLSVDGILGFLTQAGCREHCSYCAEGTGRLLKRSPASVVAEIAALADRGHTSFHLCDTEFNQDLAYCRAFLDALISDGPAVTWALYMKTAPCDPPLFSRLVESGADRVTISVPSGECAIEDACDTVRMARNSGLKTAVDLLLGFPGDTRDSIRRTLDLLRAAGPDTVGVNAIFRLYPGLAITRQIMASSELRALRFGAVEDNPDMIRPVFFSIIDMDELRDLIGGDPLFTVEGFERTSNYQRLALLDGK